MKRSFLVCVAVILVKLTLSGQYEARLSDELFISRLSDTVFVVTHYFPWESNSLIVRTSGREVVLIDTPYDVSATELMLDWIDGTMKPDNITAIITGFHVDNLGGNQCLREKGIDIYGSDRTCSLLDERGSRTQEQTISWLKPEQNRIRDVYERMVFVKPNKTFRINDGIVLKISDLTFDVFFPGESHTPDNVVVYIKECRLLFGGCMVKDLSSSDLGFTGDANINEWPVSLKIVQQKYKDARIVVPHHGLWGDMNLVQHTINLLMD